MINFMKFDSVDPVILKLIQFEIFKNCSLFDEFTVRQDYDGSAHKDTKTIPLRLGKSMTPDTKVEDLTEYSMLDEMEFEDWDNFDLFPTVRLLIDRIMCDLKLTELGWATITTLKPEGKVLPHKDEGKYCKAFTRFHICAYEANEIGPDGEYGVIKCINLNSIYVNDNKYEFRQGDVFTFANKEMHSAENQSKTHERINIIFDAR